MSDHQLNKLYSRLTGVKLFDDRTIDGKFYSKMLYGKEVTTQVWDDIKSIRYAERHEKYDDVFKRLNVPKYAAIVGLKDMVNP